MQEYVLFSAVGGHDPIANCHDGAILHISRVYQPKKVYLYLSKEMAERSDADDRYRETLKRLAKHLNTTIEVEQIKKRNLVEVQVFDAFYQEFEEILKRIFHENPGCKVLLNLSSGTPAMKSAMEIIAALSLQDVVAIQVSTPNKSENFKSERPANYDVDFYWELDEDNNENFEKRCREIHSINLLAKIKKETIITLVNSYDYHAALIVAKEIEHFLPERTLHMLQAAACRAQLDQSGYSRAAHGQDFDFIPLKTSGKREILEYVLNLQVKQKQGNLADFVRGLTPVVVDVLKEYLEFQCGIDILDYCVLNHKGNHVLNIAKMQSTDQGQKDLQTLTDYFKNPPKEIEYSSAQVAPLIMANSTDAKLIEDIDKIRNVEQNVRNMAAHEIVSISEAVIFSKTQMRSEDIVKVFRNIINKSGFHIKKEYWNSYEDMNAQIINSFKPS